MNDRPLLLTPSRPSPIMNTNLHDPHPWQEEKEAAKAKEEEKKQEEAKEAASKAADAA